MQHVLAPHLGIVATEFYDRRDRLNMTQDDLAEEAGVNRDTVSAVEKGRGSLASRRKVADALTRLEEEAGLTAPAPVKPAAEPGLMEFEVTGDFGVRVVVKGPVENASELEASVARLIRDMRNGDSPRKGESA